MRFWFFLVFFCWGIVAVAGQTPEKKVMAPIETADADRPILNMFTGEQWTAIWQIPIEVPVLYEDALKSGAILENYESPVFGAVPLKSEFLAFYSEAESGVEENYQEFVSAIAADPLTTRFPYAISIVEKLLRAVGFEYPEAHPVVLRTNENKDLMGYLLISPQKRDEIITTEQLISKRNTTAVDSIDYKAYLKLRLIDLLVNNWQKNPLVFRWENSNGIWKPIPGYYKKAFSRFEGILPDAFTTIAPQWNSFERKFPSIDALTWNSRQIDRQLLSNINYDEWKQVVNNTMSALSTIVLLESIDYLPETFRYNTGVEIFETLNARKQELPNLADEYFRFLNGICELYGSGGDDTVTVVRENDITSVEIITPKYKISREFSGNVTEEVRIFLGDGEDYVKTDCSDNNDITLRFIGQEDIDRFEDTCPDKNEFLFITLFGMHKFNNYFYDDEENTKLFLGKYSKFYDKSPPQPSLKMDMLTGSTKTRGSGFGVSPIAEFNRDDGIILGIEPMFTTYAFAKSPYDFRLMAMMRYATKSGGYVLGLRSTFNSLIEEASVMFEVKKSELLISKYFGYGNDVSYSEERYDNGGYDLSQEYFHLLGEIDFKLNPFLTFAIGGSYNFSDAVPDSADLLATFPSHNPGVGDFGYLKIFSRLVFDSRDDDFYPRSGFLGKMYFGVSPTTMDNPIRFWKGEFSADYYHTFHFLTEQTTRVTVGGGKLWNDYPFFESVLIGGAETLPGFRDYRFAGDASAYSIITQNVVLGNIHFLVKGKLGAKFLVTSGRVFSRGDLSDTWHYAMGGGFWFNGFNETIFGELYVAQSDETLAVYLTTSFKM